MSVNPAKECTCSHHRLLNFFIKEGAFDEAESLLQTLKNSCDAVNDPRKTLLYYAVEYNDSTMVQHLINHGCDVNAQDSFEDTPLMLAIQKHQVTIVDILLKNNADVYVTNSTGVNSLVMACRECIRLGLANFMKCAEFDIFKKVFEKANKVFLTEKSTITQLVLNASDPAKLAVVACGNLELAEIILKNGYPVNFYEPTRRYTALHCAVIFAKIENIKLLIKYGANVDIQIQTLSSVLFYYAFDCEVSEANSEVLEILLKHSKRWYLGMKDACLFGNENTVRIVLRKNVQCGINFTAFRFFDGNSLLHLLLINEKRLDLFRVLNGLDIQHDVNTRNANGRTALSMAISQGLLRAVDFLLRQGADVNATVDSLPPLLHASMSRSSSIDTEVESNMAQITALLLEFGADAQIVCNSGNSLIKTLSFHQMKKILNPSAKVIIAHLALLGNVDASSLTDLTRNDIESKPLFKAHFVSCTAQLEWMKNVEVHESVTLFKLLTENEEKIVAYARNQEFLSAYNNVIRKNSQLELFYFIVLVKRVKKAIDTSTFERKLACVIENLTGICSDLYRIIVYKIISYLNFQDKQNLCKVESVFLANE